MATSQSTQLIKHILTTKQTRYICQRSDLQAFLEAKFGPRNDFQIAVTPEILLLALISIGYKIIMSNSILLLPQI